MKIEPTLSPVTVELDRWKGISFLVFKMPNGTEYDPQASLPGLLPHLQKKAWWTKELEEKVLQLYPEISKQYA